MVMTRTNANDMNESRLAEPAERKQATMTGAVSKAQAKVLAAPLGGLHQSSDPEVRDALRSAVGEALMTCVSVAHAEATIRHLLASGLDWYPTVTEVRAAMEATQPSQVKPPFGQCGKCHGLGWVYSAVMGRNGFRHIKYTCVARCSCTGGAA